VKKQDTFQEKGGWLLYCILNTVAFQWD